MTPANLLFILSDEHAREGLGCYGHQLLKTPNFDRLDGTGVEPGAINARIFADQAARIEALGGDAALRRAADSGHRPAPSETAPR